MSSALHSPDAATAPSWLDRPFRVTFFRDYAAATKHEEPWTLRTLAERIRATTAGKKEALLWLKLARFGDNCTDKSCLRNDANVLGITGIEADYDGEKITVAEAVEKLEKAGVLGMVYTSPSHTKAKPRWRALCPTSSELLPEQREKQMGRLNGLLGGIFSGESWTLSQSYYFGSVNHNPSHEVHLIDGTPINEHDDLDEVWTGKPNTNTTTKANGERVAGPVDEAALLAEITSGASYHEPTVRLLGRWALQGVPMLEARQRLLGAFDAVPAADRNDRWQSRRGDVNRCLEDIYGKEAQQKDDGKRPTEPPPHPGYDEPDAAEDKGHEPLDFLADDDLTGAPELRPEHLPEAIAPFVFDTAARMGVDPAAVALSAIVSLASVMDDDWCIQPKARDDTWTENPRLWGAIVGDPSMLKSPILKATTAPIDKMEAEARERYEKAMRSHRIALKAWKDAGSDPTNEPKSPRLDRYLVEGATTEALSEALRDDCEAKQRAPARKVLIRQDEMSEWIASFDRYRSGGRGGADRGAYLRLYNGGRYTIDRVQRGTFAVPSWSACILGGIQPGPIRQIAKDAADDGLLQRFCFCVPARQTRGEDRPPNTAALARYAALFPALAALHPASNNFVAGQQRVVLHTEAHTHRLAILDLAEAMAAMPDASDRLKSALGKWPGLWARLVLVFHLIERADVRARGEGAGGGVGNVARGAATTATDYMRDILLPHLLRAEAVMFATEQTGHARWIAEFILSKGLKRIAVRDLVQAYRPLRAPEHRQELLAVVASLEAIGWVRAEERDDGRPTTTWTVNPKVHSCFAERAKRAKSERDATKERIRETLAKHTKGKTA